MQSFKAANPNCVIEDFVRWYSPRDWVEYEEKLIDPETNEEKVVKKHELSSRMKIPGNIWIEVWKSAKPVPVRRQKRLFDDTKEAENVFEWLQSLNIGQIVEQTLPILFYSAIFCSYQETHKLDIYEFVDSIFDVLVDKAIKLSRNNDTKKYPELINYIKSIEQLTSFMRSLNSKFKSNKELVNNSNVKFLFS
jgi:Rab3 GTPase-activating protein catalytic subunit